MRKERDERKADRKERRNEEAARMYLFVCRAQLLAREVTVSSDPNFFYMAPLQYSLPLGTKDLSLIDRLGILNCLPDVNMKSMANPMK